MPSAPMGWQRWLQWRAKSGRRPPVVAPKAKSEPQQWKDTMLALYGETWRDDLPGAEPRRAPRAAASGAAPTALVALAAGANEEDGAEDEADETPLRMDIFDADDEVEADNASSAISEGSWFQRNENDVRDVLSSRLAPAEPLLEFERRIFSACGVLRIRDLECDQELVERTLARARLENAARSDARGELAYYHGRVQGELNQAHGEDSASLELLLELMGEAPSGAGNANSGVRATVVGPTSVRNVATPTRRLFGATPPGGGEPRKSASAANTPEDGRGASSAAGDAAEEPVSMAGALGRLAEMLERKRTCVARNRAPSP